jgi:hypothetical protein
MRDRALAKQFNLPLCDRDRLKAMTDGELHAYFYNLSGGIKSLVLEQNPEIARRWKFYDDMPVWEFAHRQEPDSRLRP